MEKLSAPPPPVFGTAKVIFQQPPDYSTVGPALQSGGGDPDPCPDADTLADANPAPSFTPEDPAISGRDPARFFIPLDGIGHPRPEFRIDLGHLAPSSQVPPPSSPAPRGHRPKRAKRRGLPMLPADDPADLPVPPEVKQRSLWCRLIGARDVRNHTPPRPSPMRVLLTGVRVPLIFLCAFLVQIGHFASVLGFDSFTRYRDATHYAKVICTGCSTVLFHIYCSVKHSDYYIVLKFFCGCAKMFEAFRILTSNLSTYLLIDCLKGLTVLDTFGCFTVPAVARVVQWFLRQDRLADRPTRIYWISRCYSRTHRRRLKLKASQSQNLEETIRYLATTGYTEVVLRPGKAQTEFTFQGRDVLTLLWIPRWARKAYRHSSYLQLDSSFRATRPFVYCVPQAIIRNEAVPLGFVMTPSECAFTYSFFMHRLWGFLGDDERTKRPVLSDKGPGLGLFCRLYHLIQYFCHRHIIENWGAAGSLGMLAARVLRIVEKEDFLELRPQIVLEAEVLHRRGHVTAQDLKNFRNWLYASPDDFADGMWHRVPEGIARCSNHSERFHGVVNQAIKKDGCRTLANRLRVLEAEIQKRYDGYRTSKHRQLVAAISNLRKLNKAPRLVCKLRECAAFCRMMALRFGINRFPCPHTVSQPLGKIRELPDLEGDWPPGTLSQWSIKLEETDLPATATIPPFAEQPKQKGKKGKDSKDDVGIVWDDEAGPADYIGSSNHVPHWLISRGIVSGVFYFLSISRSPPPIDRMDLASAILGDLTHRYRLAYAAGTLPTTAAQKAWLGDYAGCWYSWVLTGKECPVRFGFPKASPWRDAESMVTDHIARASPIARGWLVQNSPFHQSGQATPLSRKAVRRSFRVARIRPIDLPVAPPTGTEQPEENATSLLGYSLLEHNRKTTGMGRRQRVLKMGPPQIDQSRVDIACPLGYSLSNAGQKSAGVRRSGRAAESDGSSVQRPSGRNVFCPFGYSLNPAPESAVVDGRPLPAEAGGHGLRSQPRYRKPVICPLGYPSLNTGEEPAAVHPPSLNNDSGSCFLNAAVQFLLQITRLRSYFVSGPGSQIDSGQSPLIHAYSNLQKGACARGPASAVTPWALKVLDNLPLHLRRIDEQQDACDCMGHILEGLQADLATLGLSDIIQHLFRLVVGQIVIADCCGEREVCSDERRWLDLPLLPGADGQLSLRSCLDRYFAEATMTFRVCSNCGSANEDGKDKEGIMKSVLVHVSPALILQLHRFRADTGNKDAREVPFPAVLPVPLAFHDGLNYFLKGVVRHKGRSREHGHYIAYVQAGTKWYSCNDNSIKEVTLEHVLGKEAYLLLYGAPDLEPAS
jgi:ubiquitin C-terminal hydrolase